MTDQQMAALKADFLAWSGGFLPEDDMQVVEYVESSLGIDVDYEEAHNYLVSLIVN